MHAKNTTRMYTVVEHIYGDVVCIENRCAVDQTVLSERSYI